MNNMNNKLHKWFVIGLCIFLMLSVSFTDGTVNSYAFTNEDHAISYQPTAEHMAASKAATKKAEEEAKANIDPGPDLNTYVPVPSEKNMDYYAIIYNKALEKGYDPIRAIAISRLETGNWTSDVFTFNNNFGGLTDKYGTMSFASEEAGLDRYFVTLSYYEGMSVDEMASIYCPPNATEWANEVKCLMAEVSAYFSR